MGHLIRVYMSVVLPLASRRPIGASNGSPMTVHTDQEVGIPRLVHTLPEVRQVETEIAILSVKSTGPAVAAMGSRTLGGIPWWLVPLLQWDSELWVGSRGAVAAMGFELWVGSRGAVAAMGSSGLPFH